MHPKEVLKKYFGYNNFRPAQEEIITSILDKKNVLAILPTGAGKSLCYQIPAIISENFSIIISPLISLMKDQVDAINKENEIAAFINSTMSFKESEKVLNDIAFGKIKLLYVAPERLESINFADRIKNLKPEYLFVDEAHCISEWGHNFRPSYLKIKEFIEYVSIEKISCFTATATPEVQKDIVKQLQLIDPEVIVRGFERDNLNLFTKLTRRKKETALNLIRQYKTPAIIYTASRKKAEEAAEYLNFNKIKCAYYHAGLQPEIRKKIQEDFINDEIPVIAATNAFGMGIDKKDIRLIIHYNTPATIENYYQEIGRAGRDGKDSFAYLLHHDSDINIQNFFISASHPNKELIQSVYSGICDYGKVAEGNTSDNEIPVNIDYLKAHTKKDLNRGLLHSTLSILEEGGYVRVLSEYEKKASLKIELEKNKLKEFIKKVSNKNLQNVVLYLLREYGSKVFINRVFFSSVGLAGKLKISEGELEETFTILENLGVITYSNSLAKENVILTQPRIHASRLQLDYKKINENFIHLHEKLDRIVDYVYTKECRFKYILKYFGEDAEDYKCGKCDNCRTGEILPEATTNYIKEIILRTLYENMVPINSNKLIEIIQGSKRGKDFKRYSTFESCNNYDMNDLKIVLHHLISEELIERNVTGKEVELSDKGIKFLIDNKIVEVDNEEPENLDFEKNIQLFHRLREVREKASQRFMQTAYLICPDEVLREVAAKKPITKNGMLSIKGFNNRMFNKLGIELLEVVKEFVERNKPKEKKYYKSETLPSNLKETFKLLQKGYSLKDISSLRKLSDAVISMQIETIIEYYPDIDITHLYPDKLYEVIDTEIKNGYTDLKELKEKLSEDATFPLIRIALAKNKFRENGSP